MLRMDISLRQFYCSIKNYFNGDLTTHDANILNFIRQQFTEENILYDSKLTEGLAKLNTELNACDANFTAEAQRILSLINSFTTRLDEIEQVLECYNNHFDQQSETNLSEASSNSHNSSINSSCSNSSASSSGITLTIWTCFKQIFDRDMAQRRYTFDEMCYSVAMRIRELGGDIRQSTIKNFYNRSSSCKSNTVDQIGSWIDSME
ncbi:512_t:CDS:2 [Entrophospora sp. SA101]|nr:512_t:CDS:2 [Entrophospora sp. SA101]